MPIDCVVHQLALGDQMLLLSIHSLLSHQVVLYVLLAAIIIAMLGTVLAAGRGAC